MSLLNVSDISFRHSSEPDFLFQSVTFEINPGDHVGLVGPNGSGKTTLLRIVAGELDGFTGQIARRRGLRIGYVPQESTVAWEQSTEDYVFQAFPELSCNLFQRRQLEDDLQDTQRASAYADLLADYEVQGGFQAESRTAQVLKGLGFDARERQLPMSSLSSGQRMRAQLARMLLAPIDLLLIDEPTNHLDIAAQKWLEDYLVRLEAAYLMVSHDRHFLIQSATRIFEIRRGRLSAFEGNYEFYRRQRELRERQDWERYEARQRRLESARQSSQKRMKLSRRVSRAPTGQRHGKDFYGHKAAKVARTARILRERAERKPLTSKPWTEDPIPRLDFPNVTRSGDLVVRFEGLSKGYDRKRLFSNLCFSVVRGERWGIVGPNGTGKTTFLRLLLGLEVPDAGEIHLGTGVKFGYLAQQGENLDLGQSAVALCRRVYDDETWVRTVLGCLRLKGQHAEQLVGSLSLGERSKVGLACLLLSGANVLLLDEPTNHLDIEAREAIEETLLQFPGAILFVTHDRFFLERLADKTLHLGLETNVSPLDFDGEMEPW